MKILPSTFGFRIMHGVILMKYFCTNWCSSLLHNPLLHAPTFAMVYGYGYCVLHIAMKFVNVSSSGWIESMLFGELMMLFTQGLISSKFFEMFISFSIYISILSVFVYHISHRWKFFRMQSKWTFDRILSLTILLLLLLILFVSHSVLQSCFASNKIEIKYRKYRTIGYPLPTLYTICIPKGGWHGPSATGYGIFCLLFDLTYGRWLTLC